MPDRMFDVVIFGASGRMGQSVTREAIVALSNMNWALAGRCQKKLEYVLMDVAKDTHQDLSNMVIMIVNADDERSVSRMVQNCRILVNCVGPQQKYADMIIANCIQAGTHYIDVCNDPHFNELMQLKYQEKAEANNVYIISGCGFQSFPLDVGINYLRSIFNGTINHVDSYVRFDLSGVKGPVVTSTAWSSIIMMAENFDSAKCLKKNLCTKPIPKLKPRQPLKPLLQSSKDGKVESYVRFPLMDQQTVGDSQYFMYTIYKCRPVQFSNYLVFPSYLTALIFVIWLFVISIFAQFAVTRNLLYKFCRMFSLGFAADISSNQSVAHNVNFSITYHAVGWGNVLLDPISDQTDLIPFDQHIKMVIESSNPFYGIGAITTLLAVLAVLTDPHRLPTNGGVYSPGIAFVNTPIANKLFYPSPCINVTISD